MSRNILNPTDNDDFLSASENAMPQGIRERRNAIIYTESDDESIGDMEAQIEQFTSFRNHEEDRSSIGNVESLPEITGFQNFLQPATQLSEGNINIPEPSTVSTSTSRNDLLPSHKEATKDLPSYKQVEKENKAEIKDL